MLGIKEAIKKCKKVKEQPNHKDNKKRWVKVIRKTKIKQNFFEKNMEIQKTDMKKKYNYYTINKKANY